MIEFQRQAPLRSTLDITPLIDIIFLLLLFFILTSVFAEPGIPVDLAESSTAEIQQNSENVHLSLLRNGRVILNGDVIELNALPAALRALFHETAHAVLTVNIEEDVPFSRFVELIDVAKSSGGEELIVSTEYPQ